MNKEILLLGEDTSLGSYFGNMVSALGCRIWSLKSLASGNPAGMRKELERIVKDKGSFFDWVVNCEGRNKLWKIGETIAGVLPDLLMNGNVMPFYWVIDSLVALRQPGCRVLSIASQTYRVAQTNTAIYCASKAALVQLSRTLARELAGRGWVINCLAPGKIEDTRMAMMTDAQVLELRGWTEEEANGYALRNVPMRRFTSRQEVSEAMLKILDLPAYINGTCIDMTGGA